MYNFGDSFLDISKNIAQIANPLAAAGANVFSEQQKSDINLARIRQGKRPCDSTFSQPRDCPLPLFAPKPPPQLPPGQMPPGQQGRRSGGSGILVIGLLLVAGVIGFILLSKNSEEEPDA